MTDPIYVAIDTPDLARASALADAVRPHVGGLKLGLEFFVANGPSGLATLGRTGLPIFLDLKLHDIPNTVGKAMAALAHAAPAILTVHAAGGGAMIAAAKAAAPPGCRIVAVTMLTSLDEDDLRATGVAGSPADQVRRLAALARSAGADGVVCSGQEVGSVRADWPSGFLVVPGLRPAGGETADQKRTVTPRDALRAGADVLVIGRPITAAPDPAEAAGVIAASLSAA